jgi:hypothetical protein
MMTTLHRAHTADLRLEPLHPPTNFVKMLARTAVKPTVARTVSRKAVTVRAQAHTQVHSCLATVAGLL